MKTLVLATTLLASTAALAAEPVLYRCTHGSEFRLIEVQYPQGTSVPCEVHYIKSDGESSVPWRAANSEGYCEQKAAEFVERQQGWGWQCEQPVAVQLPEVAEPEQPVKLPEEAQPEQPVQLPEVAEPEQLPELEPELEQ
ncbi:hypothetical protein [Ferrimonas marina]|uniref:DUF4124 domain-containing protein n=1 Tax=Ferrimonas marina TaxID=299255 RepID=A0A1M5XCD7_9GAMM|nr:hypothetical protein [Ferrimonas marina]SHH97515.1 hypothetical protein SAMN02745129_3434 [Ferrimonas marina]